MRALLLAATALALLCGSAYAQTSTSGSNSTTTVNTSSGSQSSSVSNPRVNVIGNSIGNGASSSTSQSRSASSSRSNSRSAAVGNVTNVYTGYSGSTDPQAPGQPARLAPARQAAGVTRRSRRTTAVATRYATRQRSSRRALWAVTRAPSALRAAYQRLASDWRWVPPGRIANANVASRRRCCSIWANRRSLSS